MSKQGKTIQDKYKEIQNLGWIQCKILDRQAQYTCNSPYKDDNKLTVKFITEQTQGNKEEIWILQLLEDYNAISVTKYIINKDEIKVQFNHGYFDGTGKHILKGHKAPEIKLQAEQLKEMGAYKGDISTKDCKLAKELIKLYKIKYNSYNYNKEISPKFIKAFTHVED